jgi:hypothetical protein
MAGALTLVRSGVDVDRPLVMAGVFHKIASNLSATTGIAVESSGVLSRKISSSIAVDSPSVIAGNTPLIASALSATTGAMAVMAAPIGVVESVVSATTGTSVSIAGVAPLAEYSLDADAFATASMAGSAYIARSGVSVTTGIAAYIEATAPAGAVADMQIWVRPTISIASTAPMPQSAIHASAVAQAVTLLAIGLRTSAVTELQSAIGIDSVAELDGVVYVAGPYGLFAMTGDTDNGTAFSQSAVMPQLDLGTARGKHLESCVMEADAEAAPVLTVTLHDGTEYNYTFSGPKRGIYRAKVGRGIAGKRVQLALSGTGIQRVDSIDLAAESGKRSF